MPYAPLPGFGGVSFFTAVVQQQRQARGSLLPVPPLPDAGAHEAGTDGESEAWLQQGLALTRELGYAAQPLASVAAAAPPRSKAERALTKRSWAALAQHVQPSPKPLVAAPADPSDANSTSTVTARLTQPPSLATVTASHVARFCSGSSAAADSKGTTSDPDSMAGLLLDEPVIPEADAVWGREAFMQGPTVLFCEQQELQQLHRDVPADAPLHDLEASCSKIVPVPYSTTAEGTMAPTASALPTTSSAQSLVRTWVLQRHQPQPEADTPPRLSAATGAAGDAPPAKLDADTTDPAGPAAATGAAAAELPGSSPQPAAAAAGRAAAPDRRPKPRPAPLEEPALPFTWLRLQDSTSAHPAAAAAAKPCSTVASISAIQAYAAAEQAAYTSGVLAAAGDDSRVMDLAGSCTRAGVVCLQVPSEAAAAAPLAGQPQGKQQRILLPEAAVPTALPMPAGGSTRSSSQPADEAEAAAASKLLPKQPSTAQVVLQLLAASRKPRTKQQPGAAAAAGGPEAYVRRHSSSTGGPDAAAPAAAPDALAEAAGPAVQPPAVQQTAAEAAGAEGAAGTRLEPDPAAKPQAGPGCPPISDTQEDDSWAGLLSPRSLLIEVPVCVPEQASDALHAQLLQSALAAAQAVLDAPPEAWLSPAAAEESPAAAAAAAAGGGGVSCSSDCPVWDPSWGNLQQQQAAGASSGDGAGGSAWCTPAVLRMLSGAALQAAASRTDAHAAPQLTDAVPAAPAAEQDSSCALAQQHSGQGTGLLEVLIAADMQLEEDELSKLMLPVVLFPDTDTPGSIGDILGSSRELQAACGYKRQPTAHLELYFDWSLLQPLQQASLGSKHSSKRRRSSSAAGSAAVKRLKMPGGAVIAPQHDQARADGAGVQDAGAWLTVLQHPGLKQLRQDVQQLPLPPMPAAGLGASAAAAATGGSADVRAWGAEKLAGWLSRQVYSAFLQQQGASTAASKPLARTGSGAAGGTEQVPADVATAAAAWHAAHQQPAPAARITTPAAPAAAAAAAGCKTGAGPSDLAFLMQLAGAGAQRSKRRRSSAAGQGSGAAAAAAAQQVQVDNRRVACPVEQQVSLSPVQPGKKPRLSAAQQQQQQEDVNKQHQQAAADLTADLALTGVASGAAAAQLAAAAAAEAAAAAGPSVVTVALPQAILRLLLQLADTRRAVLSAMQYPGPELVDALLWQDATAAHQLRQHMQQQQQAGKGLSAQQRQHSKQLSVLVAVSQTAACLLHYGIGVAHTFLQHVVQQLPAVAEACRPALAALGSASAALQQPARPASASAGSSQEGEHPKLARLREVVLQLKSAKQDCKVLVVAERHAFASLYHTLSAAGIIAVQLDRDRKLPMTAQPAGDGAAAAADPAAQAAWQSAVHGALTGASCVLASHQQLHHPCMPLQCFEALIEYVFWEDVTAGARASHAAGSWVTNSSMAAVSAGFGVGRHFIFRVQQPDLAQAAAEGDAAAEGAAGAHAAAAAVDAAGRGGSTLAEQQQQQQGAPAAPAAAGGTAPHSAAAEDAAGAAVGAPVASEVPLLLNVRHGSLIKQRHSLYQSLLQLESQGYVLVERALTHNSRGGPTPEAAALVGAAVDVVLTPRACLCIWDESKLPQDPQSALAAISSAVLALSMSYDCVAFVLELGDALLQPILRSSSDLQGLARTAGVRLQLFICFSAANTQDAVLHICKSTASSFWNPSGTTGAAGSEGSSSPAAALQPPQGLSDLPTPAEAQLGACSALNPLNAAVLASHGATLPSLFELAVSDGGLEHPLLQACVPARSLQLLQVQACAVGQCIEQRRQQEQQEMLLRQQAEQQQRQQQHPDLAGMQCAEGDMQRQYDRDPYHTEQPQWRQQQQHNEEVQIPGGLADAGWDGYEAQHMPSAMHQQQQQQRHWQRQQHPDSAAAEDERQELLGADDALQHPMQSAADWQDEGQRAPWAGSAAGRAKSLWGPDQQQQQQQRRQQRQPAVQRQREELPPMSVDPSAVLDDFLNSRGPASAGAAGRGAGAHRSPAGMYVAGPTPPSYRGHQLQDRGRAAGARADPGSMPPPPSMLRHQQQWQEAPQEQQGYGGGGFARRRPLAAAATPVGWLHGPAASAAQASPWAAAEDDEAAGFGFAPDWGQGQAADCLQVQHAEAGFGYEPGQLGAAPWDELPPPGPGPEQLFDEPVQLFDDDTDFAQPEGQGWGGPQGIGSRAAAARGAGSMASRRHHGAPPTGGMFGDGEADLLLPVSAPGRVRQGAQGGRRRRQQQQPSGVRGGMFASAYGDPDGLSDPGDDLGVDEDGAAFEPAAVPRQQAAAPRPHFAAAAAGRSSRRGRDHATVGGGGGGRGTMQTIPRGFTGRTSSSNTGSGLSVPAFMPHRNPSKQLKYKVPAAAGCVAKRRKGGKGGSFQTKLCWG